MALKVKCDGGYGLSVVICLMIFLFPLHSFACTCVCTFSTQSMRLSLLCRFWAGLSRLIGRVDSGVVLPAFVVLASKLLDCFASLFHVQRISNARHTQL